MSEVGSLGGQSVGNMEKQSSMLLRSMNAYPTPLPPPEIFEI